MAGEKQICLNLAGFRTTRAALLAAILGVGLMLSGAYWLRGEDRPSLNIRNLYSPLDKKRPVRPETRYIILHTTEGKEAGSLRKVRQRGETHYFVGLDGRVYRIIHRSKIARHAGRSCWNGAKVLDNYSIGIEVVGYHNQDITQAQYVALAELVRQLQSLYNIPDRDVLTHSMVAYGVPNRFHRYSHRGRKRCGMIFARPDVRRKLGILEKPLVDPDVEAKRLRVGDPELQAFLYAAMPSQAPVESNLIGQGSSAWTIARDKYDSPETVYTFPNGTRLRGDQVENWDRIPVGTRVDVGDSSHQEFDGFLLVTDQGKDAEQLVGDVFNEETTIYFLPGGAVRTGQSLSQDPAEPRLLADLPQGTKILVGYIYGGHVTSERYPRKIAGAKWNYPSTFYRLPDGRILSGDEIDQHRIPRNTLVFYES